VPDAPDPLIELWNSAHRADLVRVFEQAEVDRDLVYRRVYLLLEQALGSKDSPLRLQRRRSRDPWIVGAYAAPVRKKLPQGRLWLTSQFEAASDDDWFLSTTLWAKGGRRVSRIICGQLSGVVDAPQTAGSDWENGAVFLSRIRLSEHRADDSLAIDLDSLLQRLETDLRRQTERHWNNLIDNLRSV